MLVPAIALAASASTEGQVLAGGAFDNLAAKTDAVCPSRHVRQITPGDLDYIEEDFERRLSPKAQRRFRSVNRAERLCEGHNGLACLATGTLAAFERADLSEKFTAYICSHPNARMKVSVTRYGRARHSMQP